MYMWSRLSNSDNIYIAINAKYLIAVIQRDDLIKLCHIEMTWVILFLYAFQSIVADQLVWKLFCSEKVSH
jgi:hypothetical protein